MSITEQRGRVYIFADGPNFSGGTAKNFQVDVSALRDYLETYGDIRKFLWYDIEPEISDIDFERVSTTNLEKLLEKSGVSRLDDEAALNRVIDNLKEDSEAIKNAIRYYLSTQRTRRLHEGKTKYLYAIGNIAELITERGKSYRTSKRCPGCGSEVIMVGKTEAGITDFNLGIDMVYYAANDSYDVTVLISGDGHFVRPVAAVKDLRKKVVVTSFDNTINPELRALANEFLSLDSIRTRIERES